MRILQERLSQRDTPARELQISQKSKLPFDDRARYRNKEKKSVWRINSTLFWDVKKVNYCETIRFACKL